ncbi:DUF2867 domain-containing protein [Maridesulfovibrio zosterae]|uniref:DUF2867 domain-containing protein n=1 Tax=Maridesulfovibrio zosterae TaxID=82171 RepID=UPI0004128AA8|nr:DUF2867 domain-containing protein [Maridesulfovibrio zosterae]
MNDSIQAVRSIAVLDKLIGNADHIDSKVVIGDCSLEQFLDRLIRYEPLWLCWLYKVRSVIAKLMGLEHGEIGHTKAMQKKLDYTPGGKVDFFTSVDFKPDEYWVGKAEDKHLCGYIGAVAVPLSNGKTKFHIFTIVHYRNWTGPLYFNLIRPFHHIIVYFMGKHAVGK